MTEVNPAQSLGFPVAVRQPAIPDQAALETRLESMSDELTLPDLAGAIALMNLVEAGERLPPRMTEYRDATRLLARLGIFTTTLPQHAGSRWSFRKGQGTQEDFDTIVGSTLKRLETEPSYEGVTVDPRLALMEALRPDRITRIRGHNVQRNVDEKGRAMYTTHHIELWTRSEEEATVIADTLDGLFGAVRSFRVRTEPGTEGGPWDRVMIYGSPDEYTVRETGNADCLVGAQLLRELHRVTQPGYKVPFEDWLKHGHTFPPMVEAWRWALENTYQSTPVEMATYGPGETPVWTPVPKEKLLGTEMTTIFQSVRDMRRETRDEWIEAWKRSHPGEDPKKIEQREGSQSNQEQHFDRAQRMHVSAGTDLVRDRITREQAKEGPASPRATTAWERWKAETIMNTREHPVRATILTAIKAIGAVSSGGLDLLLIPLENLPENFQPRWRRYARAREAINAEFRAARPLMRIVIGVLQAEYDRRLS